MLCACVCVCAHASKCVCRVIFVYNGRTGPVWDTGGDERCPPATATAAATVPYGHILNSKQALSVRARYAHVSCASFARRSLHLWQCPYAHYVAQNHHDRVPRLNFFLFKIHLRDLFLALSLLVTGVCVFVSVCGASRRQPSTLMI